MVSFKFQKVVLKRLGERLCRESGVDPVRAAEALDALDPTLGYEENKRLYLEELGRRGVRVPGRERVEEDEERIAEWVISELPEHLRPYVEEWVREIRRLREELARRPGPPARAPRSVEEVVAEFEEAESKRRGRPVRLLPVRTVAVERPEVVREPKAWAEMTEEERREYEATRVRPVRERVVKRVEVAAVPEGMRFFMDPETRTYYEVRDQKPVPIAYDRILERVRRAMRPLVPAPKPPTPLGPMWPFRGGPRFPEIRRGMTDEEIRREFESRGIHLTDEGLKFFKQRYGLEG